MVGTVLVFLFIAQILSFYFIILLYTKISRLKDIEKSQERLKDEMDNAVGAYLAEMRDENDRLIKELTVLNIDKKNEENNNKETLAKIEKIERKSSFEKEEIEVPIFNMPRNVVAKAYQNNSNNTSTSTTLVQKESFKEELNHAVSPEKKLTLEEQIQELYQNGKTIDEIAKILQKGKTEIQLLLKFQH